MFLVCFIVCLCVFASVNESKCMSILLFGKYVKYVKITNMNTFIYCLLDSLGMSGHGCQFCPMLPQATSLDLGRFINFAEVTDGPHEGTTMRLRQLCYLNEAASVIETTSRKCPHFAWYYTLLVPHSPLLVPS